MAQPTSCPTHLWLVMLPLLYLTLFTDATLYTESRNLVHQVGESATIFCATSIKPGDALAFQIRGSPTYVIFGNSLDNIQEILLNSDLRDDISYDVSSISATDPPYVNVSMTYTINSVEAESAGTYKCQYQKESAVFTLQVVGPPSDLMVKSDPLQGVKTFKQITYDKNRYPDSDALWKVEVNLDMSGDFDLDVNVTSEPTSSVTWHKVTQTGEETVLSRTKEIIIDRTENSLDNSQFICRATNSYGTYTATVLIVIGYKPRPPAVSDPEVYPEQSKPLSLQCEFDAKPPATVWYAKENLNTNDWTRLNSSHNNMGLYISSVDLDRHVGMYRCIGENEYGTAMGQIQVHGKPKDVGIYLGDVYGDSAELNLQAFSSAPVTFNIVMNYTDKEVGVSKSKRVIADIEESIPNIRYAHTIELPYPNTVYTITLKAANKHGEAVSSAINVTSADAGVTKSIILKVVDGTTSTEKSHASSLHSAAILVWCIVGALLW